MDVDGVPGGAARAAGGRRSVVHVDSIDYTDSIAVNWSDAMATLTIRNLDEDTKARLRVRAARHGRSMEEEARTLLAAAVRAPSARPADLAASREALRKQAQELADLANLYRDQKAEVLSATKLKAEFLANMNHEIRTPLNAILGFAEVIENEVLGPVTCAKYRDYAAHIRISGGNLLTIIDDILEMAHIEAGRVKIERSSSAIANLLEDAATGVALDAAKKHVRIEIDPTSARPEGLLPVELDIRATTQALIHLTRNAIRLSPTHGTVTMRARRQGDYINIFISDRGCHLSQSDIGTLTKPFGHIDGMLHDGCKGSGLSVAIARGLIELQGGTLRIRSAPELGAIMMLHLPIVQRPHQLDLPMA